MSDMICGVCSKGFTEGGAGNGAEESREGICDSCLDEIYPGRSTEPVFMDGDGNLYFIETKQQRVVIIFKYGSVPYSSRTEIDASDEQMECEGFFLMG